MTMQPTGRGRPVPAGRGGLLALAACGLVTGAVSASGCSADLAPGAAAVDSDGRVLATVSEVEEISAELAEALQLTDNLDRGVLLFLVIGDDVREIAGQDGTLVSAESVQQEARAQGIDLSERAADVLAVNTMYNQIVTGDSVEALNERLASVDPVVNPRFGAVEYQDNGQLTIVDQPLPWMGGAADADLTGGTP
jgi:hypothetical protein